MNTPKSFLLATKLRPARWQNPPLTAAASRSSAWMVLLVLALAGLFPLARPSVAASESTADAATQPPAAIKIDSLQIKVGESVASVLKRLEELSKKADSMSGGVTFSYDPDSPALRDRKVQGWDREGVPLKEGEVALEYTNAPLENILDRLIARNLVFIRDGSTIRIEPFFNEYTEFVFSAREEAIRVSKLSLEELERTYLSLMQPGDGPERAVELRALAKKVSEMSPEELEPICSEVMMSQTTIRIDPSLPGIADRVSKLSDQEIAAIYTDTMKLNLLSENDLHNVSQKGAPVVDEAPDGTAAFVAKDGDALRTKVMAPAVQESCKYLLVLAVAAYDQPLPEDERSGLPRIALRQDGLSEAGKPTNSSVLIHDAAMNVKAKPGEWSVPFVLWGTSIHTAWPMTFELTMSSLMDSTSPEGRAIFCKEPAALAFSSRAAALEFLEVYRTHNLKQKR